MYFNEFLLFYGTNKMSLQLLLIKEAPQPTDKNACHGHEFLTASIPPTIRIPVSIGAIDGTPHAF